MKRFAPALAGVVTAALLAAPGAVRAQGEPDTVTSFKLPPAPSDTPQAQGPVVEGVPLPRAPRPTSTPTAAAPAAVPSPTPSPAQPEAPAAHPSPAAPAASATASATARSPASSAARAASTESEGSAASPSATASPEDASQPAAESTAVEAERTVAPGRATASAPPPTAAQLPALPPSAAAASNWADKWLWLLGGFVLAWLIAGVAWLWRQRHETGGRLLAPPIERPRPRAADANAEPSPALADPEPEEEDLAELAASEASPLRCTLEATRLSLSLLNVTLSYRLTLHNLSGSIIRDITVGSDLVTAHASLPMNQQMAGTEQVLQPQHNLPLLLPGQNTQLSGELRLPIPAIHPLRRADAVMFVPLLRLRIDAQDLDQIMLQTVVIGQKPAGPGAGLRPFRLDLGPRVYGEIGHRLLSAQG